MPDHVEEPDGRRKNGMYYQIWMDIRRNFNAIHPALCWACGMTGMLLEQVEQNGARLIAIAFQAVNAGQVQVRLIEAPAPRGYILRT